MDEFERLQKHLNKLAPYLGYMIIEFNALEDTLDRVIVEFLSDRVDEIGYAVISGMSFKAKVGLLGRLVGPLFQTVKKTSWPKKLESIVRDLEQAANLRNDIVHAAWVEYDLKTSTARTKTRIRNNALQKIQKKIQPRDIRKAITFMSRLDNRLYGLFEDQQRWWA